ncbi:MAG: 4Fe-4S cluster-binding domain-containing protein, partial [Candidatus Hydrogenedentes bacterium]|nr:4Fe-4S cluster-binding domain-containing protein [Candidatus Hydrogenedentota bacterium]
RMLVVLPNMSCKLRCPNCFTWNSGVMPSDQRMELSLIESIVRQAAEMEVSCVELSGGGEPLEHPEAEKMLQVLVEGRNKHKTFRAGLITNGLEITRMLNLGDWIVQLDYVRLGYTEYFDRPGHDSAKSLFWEALEILGQKKMQDERAKVRIGVKLLLTRDNATSLEERLEGILRLKARRTQRYVVDHVKIKSIRGDNEPTPDLIRAMEHKLTLLKSKLGERANDLQIDIKSAKVPSTYSCWINPIMSVIGVSGDVYLCCNFYECPDDLKIGSLGIKGEDHFREFWGKARHRDVMDRVAPASVCNSRWGCHCRLVHYQELVEPLVPYSDRDTPVIGTFFVGHEKML